MILIAQNIRELSDSIISVRTDCNWRAYPTEYRSYDEAWEELNESVNHLKFKLGSERYPRLLAMLERAKEHYDKAEVEATSQNRLKPGEPGFEEIKLGSWLMQDIELVVNGKAPAVYPKELASW